MDRAGGERESEPGLSSLSSENTPSHVPISKAVQVLGRGKTWDIRELPYGQRKVVLCGLNFSKCSRRTNERPMKVGVVQMRIGE